MKIVRYLLMVLVLLVTGCGYHVPGAGDEWAGGAARLLYIELLENRAAEPYLENYVTDALVEELSRSRRIELTEDPDAAELHLAGSVDSFSSSALAYSSADRISAYRATMSITTRLVRHGSNQVLWQRQQSRSEDYQAFLNKSLQLEGQRLAAQQVAKRLAEDVHAQLLIID